MTPYDIQPRGVTPSHRSAVEPVSTPTRRTRIAGTVSVRTTTDSRPPIAYLRDTFEVLCVLAIIVILYAVLPA